MLAPIRWPPLSGNTLFKGEYAVLKFEAEIKAAAEKYEIPFYLLCEQIRQESAFNPLATSPCGARGLMQIMPKTGYELGLKDHEFFDVEKNLDAGTRYFRQQFRSMKNMCETLPKGAVNACTEGDYYMLALACYNGGMGYVLKAINLCISQGLTVRWENVESMLTLPECTVRGKRPDHKQIRDYVARIWAKYKTAVGQP